MQRALHIEKSGAWPRETARGTVTLAFDDRHRRRLKLTTDQGEAFLLDLPRTQVLASGDGLQLEDGGWIAVEAAAESVIEITAEPALLCRVAWHLGNRHLPTQMEPHRILIREDHVIADMLKGLGATVRLVSEPFTPEGGAYEGHSHAPDHGHDHSHDHDYSHHHHHGAGHGHSHG